jgi:hypothetical protein
MDDEKLIIMKFVNIILILFCFSVHAYSQNDKSISIAELLMISEKSDFKTLVSLTKKLSYVVLDSSQGDDGSLSYFTREFKTSGDILACSFILKNKTMNILGFYTQDSVLCANLKAEIIKLGFTTKGKSKFEVPGYVETQEYNKGKSIIAFGIKKVKNRFEYGFEFIKG